MTKIIKDLGFVHKNKEGRPVHRFLCSCGKTKAIQLRYVLAGITKSCGCLKLTAGADASRTHGLRNNPLYATYSGMMRRCYTVRDKEYKNYGGRGIKVVAEWHDIKKFVQDMEPNYHPGLSIDRINNDGDYSKGNCQWATPHQQARNKRSNIFYNGECATDYAKRIGASKSAIIMRVWRGWTIEKAFTTPLVRKSV